MLPSDAACSFFESFLHEANSSVTAEATASNVVYANDAANYYWSRRGPSVHMSYGSPANTEWMYNEMTIPEMMTHEIK